MSNGHSILIIVCFILTVMTIDEFDIAEDASFCGWDSTDSLQFKQNLIKIGKPSAEMILKTNRNKFKANKQANSSSSDSSKSEKKYKKPNRCKPNKSKTERSKPRKLAPLKPKNKKIDRCKYIRHKQPKKKRKTKKLSKMGPNVRQISPRNALNQICSNVQMRDHRRYHHHHQNRKTLISRKRIKRRSYLNTLLNATNCTQRELVPIVTKLSRANYADLRLPKVQKFPTRQVRQEGHDEIEGIIAQRRMYLNDLHLIFESFDKYVRKLDAAKISKMGKQIESILCRYDKNIIHKLTHFRKTTWNLVFFLKSVQWQSAIHQSVIGAVLENFNFLCECVHVGAYLHLPNTQLNPFLLPKSILDPMNRCAHSKKLKNAVHRLKAVHFEHDLNKMYKLNEMDRHRYLSAHQWLLQLHQRNFVSAKTTVTYGQRSLKFPRLHCIKS